MRPAESLTVAYHKSGMTPLEFYQHIVTTRKLVRTDELRLSFKVQVPAYGFDLEWFGYDQATNTWIEL